MLDLTSLVLPLQVSFLQLGIGPFATIKLAAVKEVSKWGLHKGALTPPWMWNYEVVGRELSVIIENYVQVHWSWAIALASEVSTQGCLASADISSVPIGLTYYPRRSLQRLSVQLFSAKLQATASAVLLAKPWYVPSCCVTGKQPRVGGS